MKVKELIGFLNEQNPESDVLFFAGDAIRSSEYELVRDGQKVDPDKALFSADAILAGDFEEKGVYMLEVVGE